MLPSDSLKGEPLPANSNIGSIAGGSYSFRRLGGCAANVTLFPWGTNYHLYGNIAGILLRTAFSHPARHAFHRICQGRYNFKAAQFVPYLRWPNPCFRNTPKPDNP